MSRPKGALNKKTIDGLKSIGEDGNIVKKDNIPSALELQEQVAKLTMIISELTDKITQKENPKKADIESQYNLQKDLNSTIILTKSETEQLIREKENAIKELKGVRNVIATTLGGTVSAYEDTTGDKAELYKRIAMANRALATQGRPKLSDDELNKLKKEYTLLSEELKKVIPSKSSCWQINSSDFSDAVNRITLMQTKYQKQITRWQNIGKLIDPDNPSLWDVDSLAKP